MKTVQSGEIATRSLSSSDLPLEGLHIGSLGHYLAALGLMRVLQSIDGYRGIACSWCAGRFILYSPGGQLDANVLISDIRRHWIPAKFDRWWEESQKASKKNRNALPQLRSRVSDNDVEILDSVMVQADDKRIFNLVFGTGGVIGKRNLASFSKKCVDLIKKPQSESWLRHTLLGEEDAILPELKGGATWFVYSNKTFNSGQDWYREGRLSPWSFLFAVQGAMLIRGSVHRRLGSRMKGRAVFPFTCRPASPTTSQQVGYGRCEFWAPLWNKPATFPEIEALFRAGLVEVGGRPAYAPHEFAVAVLAAAVDAGVGEFVRFDLRQTTSAKVFEAIPRERIKAQRQRALDHSGLVLPLVSSGWLDRLAKEPVSSKQRGKFIGLRGPVEEAIIQLCESPEDAELWQKLLCQLAHSQHRIDRNTNLRETCAPVPRLDPAWFDRAWPDPPSELRVARAIASIFGVYRLASNIFGVTEYGNGVCSFPKTRPHSAVWHDGSPTRRLVDVLRRRLVDAKDLDPPPLSGYRKCALVDVALFLAGYPAFDDAICVQWLPALSLIDWSRRSDSTSTPAPESQEPLHPLYSLFRPLVSPDGVRVGRKDIFRSDDWKPHTAAVRKSINLILQNDIGEAVALARQRYLAAGWRILEVPITEVIVDVERLVAALLIPANPSEVGARFRQDWLLSPL
ncbi:MAG TPA: type I-U CRISPR-associated protein Csx17 [Candidatus Obscuribacterales bacterium]